LYKKEIKALPKRYISLSLALTILPLNSCVVTTLIGGGTAAGSATFDERKIGEHFDDVAIAAKIKARLIAEKDLPSRWISVEVLRGRAVLTGRLPRQDQIDRAIFISRSFKGVKDVRSEIRLGKPSMREMISDTWITTQIKRKLLNDPITSGFSIHVETEDGTVYLQGFVKNKEQQYRAKDLALSVSGVAAVENQLQVEP